MRSTFTHASRGSSKPSASASADSPTTSSRRSSASTTSGTRSRTTSSARWARWACSGCRSPRSTAAWAATTSPSASPWRSWPGSTPASPSPSRPAISLGAMPIYRFGTDEQKATVAAAAASPARPWRRSGSPSRAPAPTPAAPQTRAVLDEATGEWVINGSKAFITNSGTDITAWSPSPRSPASTRTAQGALLDHRAVRHAGLHRRSRATPRSAGAPPTRTS